jgi:hypothetical protein
MQMVYFHERLRAHSSFLEIINVICENNTEIKILKA